jgi:vancomycin resistance protein VanJ
VILLLLSYIAPYVKPSSISTFPLLSLATPILICINLAFIIYWLLIGLKKQYLLSSIVLILGFLISSSIYKLNSTSTKPDEELTIMTYNVRKFNVYEWLKDKDIDTKINDFISSEKPDILAIQEFKNEKNFNLDYPYKYNPIIWKKQRSDLVLYSKYPVVNSGIVKQNKLNGKAIYIDIIKNADTTRIYNFHLQSLGVIPDEDFFGHSDSEKLLKRLRISFKLQEEQIDTLIKHINKCKYKVILVGDMNNTAYSWSYKNLRRSLQDSFLETGNGFGKTYSLKGFPFRIDYIFVDKDIKVHQHKNYAVKYSDHYPVMATVSF